VHRSISFCFHKAQPWGFLVALRFWVSLCMDPIQQKNGCQNRKLLHKCNSLQQCM
jgi:hypothetical protein